MIDYHLNKKFFFPTCDNVNLVGRSITEKSWLFEGNNCCLFDVTQPRDKQTTSNCTLLRTKVTFQNEINKKYAPFNCKSFDLSSSVTNFPSFFNHVIKQRHRVSFY